MPLAFLKSPLQLSGEEALVIVRLETIAACEKVHRDLRSGEPVATVGHRSQAYREAAGFLRQVLVRFPFFRRGLFVFVGCCLRLLFLFELLRRQSANSVLHG